MKKLILFLSLSLTLTDCSGMSYVKNFLSTRSTAIKARQDDIIAPRVAIIYITDDMDFKTTILNLVDAAKAPEILGIILIVDNHGGRTAQFSMLHDSIKKISALKPIISLVTVALSGGYMVASATNYIIAHRCADIGSIGVMMEVSRFRDPIMKNNGIETKYTMEIFKAGEYKGVYNAHNQELSEKERVYIQNDIDKAYTEFKKMVAEDRNLNLEESDLWAEAQNFIAHEALSRGLIDEIGTIFEAETKILELIRDRHATRSFKDEIRPCFYDNKEADDKSA